MNSRKGLKRYGMRSYIVEGATGAFVIQRDRPWRFLVRNAKFANIFSDIFAVRFRSLFAARQWAEEQAGCQNKPISPPPSGSKGRKKSRRKTRQNRSSTAS